MPITPKGGYYLADPQERLMQGQLMLARRLQGVPKEEIAREFRVSLDTVERRIKQAKREGALEEAVEKIVGDLLQKSLSAYEELLTNPDISPKVRLAAAKDIAFGTGALSTNNKAQVAPQDEGSGAKQTLSLRAWREKRFATKPSHLARKAGASRSGDESADEAESFEDVSVLELTGELPARIIEADFTPHGDTGLPHTESPPDFEGNGEEI